MAKERIGRSKLTDKSHSKKSTVANLAFSFQPKILCALGPNYTLFNVMLVLKMLINSFMF